MRSPPHCWHCSESVQSDFSLGPISSTIYFFIELQTKKDDENKITIIFQLQFDGRLDNLRDTILSFSFSLLKMHAVCIRVSDLSSPSPLTFLRFSLLPSFTRDFSKRVLSFSGFFFFFYYRLTSYFIALSLLIQLTFS